MKQSLILAGAALAFAAAPAVAKPGHVKGHGNARGAHHSAVGYGVGGCPPGLAKKGNGCMPPGQTKKLYRVGQRYPGNYGRLWSYNQIPYNLRTRYNFDDDYRYYYGDGYLYRVDPKTLLIQQVVSAILR